jgi:hypothetical protein
VDGAFARVIGDNVFLDGRLDLLRLLRHAVDRLLVRRVRLAIGTNCSFCVGRMRSGRGRVGVTARP